MPNWIRNRVRISGNTEDVERLKAKIAGKDAEGNDTPITFENIEPMPDNVDWRDWRILHWGCKWDACEASLEGDTYCFDTPWGNPLGAMITLSMMFPELEIEESYADEDYGYNCGTYTLKNGKMLYRNIPDGGTDEAMALYADVWWDGDLSMFEKDSEGRWCWKDE